MTLSDYRALKGFSCTLQSQTDLSIQKVGGLRLTDSISQFSDEPLLNRNSKARHDVIKVKNSLNLGELIDIPMNHPLRRSDLDCSFFNPREAVTITHSRTTLNKSIQHKTRFTFTEEEAPKVNKTKSVLRQSPSRLELAMRSTHKQNSPSTLGIGGGGDGFKVLKKRSRLSPMLQGQFLHKHEQGVFGPQALFE